MIPSYLKKLLKFLAYFFLAILLIGVVLIRPIDRTPPNELPHFSIMMSRLDSVSNTVTNSEAELFQIGTSKVSITPDSTMDLAGYGNRRPKSFDNILDSIFVRTIVIKTPTKKVTILSADLLIVHPKITAQLYQALKPNGWNKEEVFLSATHSHSSIGQWAPGLVGGLFAGAYNEKVGEIIAKRMLQSILEAEENVSTSSFGFSQSENSDLVLNRLVREKGIEDPLLKNLYFESEKERVLFSAFSAHATCLTSHSWNLSGDYPSWFHKAVETDSSVDFSLFAAGPVASMGPETPKMDQVDRTKFLGRELANRIRIPEKFNDSLALLSFSIPVELGAPQFKIYKNLALRSFLFNYAFGDEPAKISVLKMNQILLIGTPCDFSGELAVPLYEYAKSRGFELIITSFNGGYIGYVTDDQWYDLEKYETRTMNWYGPGNGDYFTKIIKRIIDSF